MEKLLLSSKYNPLDVESNDMLGGHFGGCGLREGSGEELTRTVLMRKGMYKGLLGIMADREGSKLWAARVKPPFYLQIVPLVDEQQLLVLQKPFALTEFLSFQIFCQLFPGTREAIPSCSPHLIPCLLQLIHHKAALPFLLTLSTLIHVLSFLNLLNSCFLPSDHSTLQLINSKHWVDPDSGT